MTSTSSEVRSSFQPVVMRAPCGRVCRVDWLTAADSGDDELDSAALFDERSVLGDDVGGGAADSSESDNAYMDLFHKRSSQLPVASC